MNYKILLTGVIFLLAISGTAFAKDRPDNLFHRLHMDGLRGDFGIQYCNVCHGGGSDGRYDRKDDPTASRCNACHSPDGQFDGVKDSDIGAWRNHRGEADDGNMTSSIYDSNGNFKPGKENWCLGCHDDGHSVVRGVAAVNVAGRYLTGTWQSPAGAIGTSGEENLVDGSLDTGNPTGVVPEMIFDLGTEKEITHIRLYNIVNNSSMWEVYGSLDGNSWDRILYGQSFIFARPVWKVGPQEGWNEFRLDKFGAIRYVKFVKVFPGNLIVNSLREFEYKSDVQYGALTTGHGVSCDYCHDTQSVHIDGIARTYKSELDNYSDGYRLVDVEVDGVVVPALDIPRTGVSNGDTPMTDNDFALCLGCHDGGKILGDAYGTGMYFQQPLATNFRNDTHFDRNGNVVNEHLRHLRGRGRWGDALDWDSDWDGVPDSTQSCVACHNVHGSPNPVMTRHGELVSTPGTEDKVPMFNFRYLNMEGMVDPDLKDVAASTGGQNGFIAPGPGSVEKNHTCRQCHGDRVTYTRTPADTGM